MKTQEKSRFKEHLQKQTYHNIYLAVGGIVVLIILIVLFGANILIGFSLLVGKLTGSSSTQDTTNITQNAEYIAPPSLDTPATATNSAQTTISGTGTANQKITLYRDGDVIDHTTVDDTNKFSFENITLNSGQNTFQAKASNDNNKQSDFSNQVHISLQNKTPTLDVNSPTEGQKFKKDLGPVKISGKTDQGASVTVNDFRAIVNDDGTYSYLYTLHDGDNHLKIVATDEAGNKTTKELTIKTE